MLRFEDVVVLQGAFTLRAEVEVPVGARGARMGASGSGKSTLLSTLAGFTLPDAGRIWIDGQDVTEKDVAARPLSILFQDGNLFPHLSVFDNVALGRDPRLRLSTADREAVEAALNQVDLGGFGGRKPADLSGGQQSRVALARLLLRQQPLALLDESFAALDPGLRREMLDQVKALCEAQGLTLVMATHDLRDAERLCDNLILLDAGKVVLDQPLAEAVDSQAPALQPWM